MSNLHNSNQKVQESKENIYFFPPELFFRKSNLQAGYNVNRETIQKPISHKIQTKSTNFNLREKPLTIANRFQLRFK